MFTGIVLHYLLKELNVKGEVKIDDIVRVGEEISVVFKKHFLTANLSSRAPYISFKKIKGQGYLSSVFKGKRISRIEQLGLDRILIISLEEDLKIIFEIFGRRSDCLFLRGDEILNSLKGIKKDKYKFPSIPEAFNFFEAGKEELVEAMISGEKISGLSVGFVKSLKMKGIEFVDSFAEREFGPTVYEDILSPFVLPEGKRFPAMNEAIIYNFEERIKEEERKRLLLIIETELEKKIIKNQEILRRLSKPKDISVYKQMGDALLTYQGYIDFSKDKVILDYMDKKFEIEIDSSLSVMQNAQYYFELFKKEKRKAESEEQRKRKIEKELNVLRKRERN